MTVAELIEALENLPQDADVAIRSVELNQRVRFDPIEIVRPVNFGIGPTVVLVH